MKVILKILTVAMLISLIAPHNLLSENTITADGEVVVQGRSGSTTALQHHGPASQEGSAIELQGAASSPYCHNGKMITQSPLGKEMYRTCTKSGCIKERLIIPLDTRASGMNDEICLRIFQKKSQDQNHQ